MEGSRGEHKHGGRALWLPVAFTSKTERALCVSSEWSVSLFALCCVAFFFSAKPLGWESAINKGCISFICSDRLWLYLCSMRQRIITFWRAAHGSAFETRAPRTVRFPEKTATLWPQTKNTAIHIRQQFGFSDPWQPLALEGLIVKRASFNI